MVHLRRGWGGCRAGLPRPPACLPAGQHHHLHRAEPVAGGRQDRAWLSLFVLHGGIPPIPSRPPPSVPVRHPKGLFPQAGAVLPCLVMQKGAFKGCQGGIGTRGGGSTPLSPVAPGLCSPRHLQPVSQARAAPGAVVWFYVLIMRPVVHFSCFKEGATRPRPGPPASLEPLVCLTLLLQLSRLLRFLAGLSCKHVFGGPHTAWAFRAGGPRGKATAMLLTPV